MAKHYDRLYLDILKIGIKKAETGLQYQDLYDALKNMGYDVYNSCISLAIEQWFFDCFHHLSSDCEPVLTIKQFRADHQCCNFIMKGESCLALLNYQTSKRNNKIALYAFIAAMISIVVSVVSIWPQKEQSQPLKSEREQIVIPNLNTNQYYLKPSDTTK